MNDHAEHQHRPWLKLFLIMAFLGVAGWWVWQSGMIYELEPERLSGRIQDHGPLAPLSLTGLMALAVVIGPIPTFPITLASGLVFGAAWGVFYATLGAMIGAAISFWIARIAGRKIISKLLKGHISFCGQCSDRLLFGVVLAARLLPIVSFAMVSYAAGLTAMRMPAYLLATLLGMLPVTIVVVTLGANLDMPIWIVGLAGGLIVLFIFVLPSLIERRNLLGLKKFFPHVQ